MLFTVIILMIFNVCLIFSLRFLAPRINLVDYPGGRKAHAYPTPLIGGISSYVTLLVAVAINNDSNSSVFDLVVLWAGAIVLIGIVDDILNVRWFFKLLVQIVATVGVVLASGIKVSYLGTYPFFGAVYLGQMSEIFTVFAVVCVSNAFNLIDGIDGLSGSLLLLPVSALMGISLWLSGEADFFLLVLMASLALFLIFNMHENKKTKIFFGDSGSAGLGFIVSFLVIFYMNNEIAFLAPPFALWIFLIPITDTINVTVSRALKGKSIFNPGSDHLHHRLMAIGYSSRLTLAILFFLSVLGVVIGLLLNFANNAVSVFAFILTSACIQIALIVEIRKLQLN